MSLVEIAPPPTAENAVIHLNPSDNIAVARVPLAAGQKLRVDSGDVTALEAVPMGHKIALRCIRAGDQIVRYGHPMGRATQGIEAGEHVHTHNVGYEEHALEYPFPESEVPLPAPAKNVPTFLGYRRGDGRAGTRNYIAVVAA